MRPGDTALSAHFSEVPQPDLLNGWALKTRSPSKLTTDLPEGRQCVALLHRLGSNMIDWSNYRDKLMAKIGDIARLSPDTVQGYALASEAGTKTGNLDAKTRE